MKMRERYANALAKLAGEPTIIDDLSLLRVLDVLQEVGIEIASESYKVGNDDGVDGKNKLQKYLKSL